MSENTQGSGRQPFLDLTNILGKRPAPLDLEKNAGAVKIGRVEKAFEPRKGYDDNVKASGGMPGNIVGRLLDGAGKDNFIRTSIFRGAKVKHMAAEAAGLLSKDVGEQMKHYVPLDSSSLNVKEESSLESEGGSEEDDDDGTDSGSELQAYTRESNKMSTYDRANDDECLTQEELVVSSGNQNPVSSFDITAGDDIPCSNSQHPQVETGSLEESSATKSCACSFCLKAAFMWSDLHYQDARSRLAALKKSIKFARSLGAKSQANEYTLGAGIYNSKRAAEMEFELSQQQRSLFLHTENVLVRESAQLHTVVVKLKDLTENCKADLGMASKSLFGK